jgi:hypothetical protein
VKQLDPIDLEHLEQTLRTAGYGLIRSYLTDALASVVKGLLEKGLPAAETEYLRGYYHGIKFALSAPDMMRRKRE